ncbi:anti-phage dCTP deaminase [Chitinophaga sp. S165]|uniref:anti-phage dCTP deaminase n=1 Tax=Chitinophaga sp. S165 TaxID=2135462 RepID=UPI000D71227B|nr:anti-phage dCTP deaminase [Chitinophaga sp. S165]PWV54497.1 deoxycytidylate deaminase [Chitinophaga sp. S165]
MPEGALKVVERSSDGLNNQDKIDRRELKEKISSTHTEELIIGLCGPIGTDIHFVADSLKHILESEYNYDCRIIKLSSIIRKKAKVLEEAKFASKYLYLEALIDAGNEFRRENGANILAQLAISEIAAHREDLMKKDKDFTFTTKRVCYIVDSIKNHEELELFRLIYSGLFYFFGVFSNVQIREKVLEKKGLKKEEIYHLIDRDSGEEVRFGQRVSDTFTKADFFLRLDQSNGKVTKAKISRFLSLIFNSEIITPTNHETAMYQAFAAAGNSACLSRQVGASITDEKGEIVSVGWNDVPKYGGGVYKSIGTDLLGADDHRCMNFETGKCFNDEEKSIIRDVLVKDLVKNKVIKESDISIVTDIIKKSRLKELIEFSRAVHAEMHAIIEGSQNSAQGIKGGKLYCTTYPCHNCARHIVAAGISEVYYIEPYRKSLALKLHYDSITENETEDNKLKVLLFDGVSPLRFLELFKMSENARKVNGKKIDVEKKSALPKKTISLQAIPILEKKVIEDLKEKHLINS